MSAKIGKVKRKVGSAVYVSNDELKELAAYDKPKKCKKCHCGRIVSSAVSDKLCDPCRCFALTQDIMDLNLTVVIWECSTNQFVEIGEP